MSTVGSRRPAATRWRDPKRWWWLMSPAFPILVWINLARYLATGDEIWLWVSTAVVYGGIPLLDTLLGPDRSNVPEALRPAIEADPWYRFLLVLFVPFQYGLTVQGAWIAATQPLSLWGWVGLVLSVGGINGVGINTAHELGHKRPRWERWLSRVTLAPVAYGHFYVEHNRGHHLRVATPEDPASSRMGEGFWTFLPRTVIGSLQSAWALESARMSRLKLPPWHWRNQCLQAWSMTLILYGALALWLGWAVLPFLAAQSAYGISLLEVVNYIEHFGLLRPRDAHGHLAPCDPTHSWNSDHRVSNVFLYQLQRHSDHHAHPGRRYQVLRHFDESPQLPSGYAGMLLLAYAPPLWFRVMDPRVVAHYGGDLQRANLQPSRRQRLLARWGCAPTATAATATTSTT